MDAATAARRGHEVTDTTHSPGTVRSARAERTRTASIRSPVSSLKLSAIRLGGTVGSASILIAPSV